MRRVILTVLFLSMFIFSGCIVSSLPTSPIITMDKGDTLEFSTVVYPESCTALWTLKYNLDVEDTATGLHYTFTPDKAGSYTMKLDVSEPLHSTKSKTWVIFVQ